MFVSYRLVHFELCVVLVAEQFIRPRGGELFGRTSQKQEIVEEESPQVLVALCLEHLDGNKYIKDNRLNNTETTETSYWIESYVSDDTHLPTVEQFSGAQTVCERVKNQGLLEEKNLKRIRL